MTVRHRFPRLTVRSSLPPLRRVFAAYNSRFGTWRQLLTAARYVTLFKVSVEPERIARQLAGSSAAGGWESIRSVGNNSNLWSIPILWRVSFKEVAPGGA